MRVENAEKRAREIIDVLVQDGLETIIKIGLVVQKVLKTYLLTIIHCPFRSDILYQKQQ